MALYSLASSPAQIGTKFVRAKFSNTTTVGKSMNFNQVRDR